MKKMMIVLLILGSIIVAPLAGFCQNDKNRKEANVGEEQNYDKLKSKLSLSDDQVGSWKKLEQKYGDRIQTIKNNSSLSQEEKKSHINHLQDAKDADLKNILTTEQYSKYTGIQTR